MRRTIAILLSWVACSIACEADTGGALVHIEMQAETESQDGQALGRFETSTGFLVELSEAKLALDSILVYAPDKNAGLSPSGLWLSKARAHGGFDPFNGRRVRAEYKESQPVVLDLLTQGPHSLGTVQAEAGEISSATLVFAGTLGSVQGQAWVRGTASRGSERIAFEGALQLENQTLLRRVDGVQASGELREGGTLRVVFRPQLWFDEAHFDRLPETASGPRMLTPESQVHTAWAFGVRSTKAYETRWSTR